MKEGYLQNKVENQSRQIENFQSKINALENSLQELNKKQREFENRLTEIRTHEVAIISDVLKSEIKDNVETIYAKYNQEKYSQMHFIIANELKIALKSMKTLSNSILYEMQCIMKEVSSIRSLLVKKGLTTEKEMIAIDMKIKKSPEFKKMRQEVIDHVYPKIIEFDDATEDIKKLIRETK